MREIHVSSAIGVGYHCPPCDKYFKNRMSIYNHVKMSHKDWQGVNYDDFAVKS